MIPVPVCAWTDRFASAGEMSLAANTANSIDVFPGGVFD